MDLFRVELRHERRDLVAHLFGKLTDIGRFCPFLYGVFGKPLLEFRLLVRKGHFNQNILQDHGGVCVCENYLCRSDHLVYFEKEFRHCGQCFLGMRAVPFVAVLGQSFGQGLKLSPLFCFGVI